MDEQRAWIKSKRKRTLRTTAIILSICLLITTYPDILETLSVFATGLRGDDEIVSISGFSELPEEICKQAVPVGTEISELKLPDTLEAFAAVSESGNPPEGEDQPENPEGEDEDQPQTPEDEGTTPPEDGTIESDDDSDNSEDVEQPAEEENDDIVEPDVEQYEDNNDAEPELLSMQNGAFVMPVYMAEPMVMVESQTLERKEETVMIKGVTWQSEPAYNGDVEGIYIFTAVLPEDYALSEGVSLPQITVTVQGNDEDAVVQALLERITALPDVQEYMEKEPDIDNWKEDDDAYEEAYEEWMEGLSAFVEEALDIWEAYEALTQKQQAQIPEELLAKLTAWMELAEKVAGNTMVMAAASHTCNNITFTEWTSTNSLPTSGFYYLSANVNLGTSSSNACKLTGTLNLCLNGHTISGNVPDGMFRIDGGTLNIYDCSASKLGKIQCPQNTTGHNPILVTGNGVLNLYGGTVQSYNASAIPIGTGTSDTTGGTVNVYSEATIIGVSNGITVNKNLSSSHVNIYGGSIISGSGGKPVNMQNPNGSVTMHSDAAMTPQPSIYTVTPVVSKTPVSNTYTINYVGVKEGDIVVEGSTDTVHYKLPDSSSYVIVPDKGNLIAAKSEYTVELNTNGGSGGTGLTRYTTGQGANLPTDWTKANYVFEGWYEKADLSGTKVESISNTDFGNKTYYAKWKPVSYTITYTLDNGTVTGNPESYTIESDTITLNNPTRTGYTFDGWSGTDLTGSSNKSVTIAKGSSGNRSYTAHWTANTYKITYSGLTGASLTTKPAQHTYGTATTVGTPTKTGYTFEGWKINGATATKTTTLGAKAYTEDITLEATWTATSYTISYTLNNGTVTGNPTNYTIESNAITLNNPTRTGYIFTGWSGTDLTGSSNKSVTISKGSTGNRSYTAHWTANTYNITYKDENGATFSGTHGSSNPIKHTYGTTTTLVSPTKTGYGFSGWYTNSNCTGNPVTSLGANSYTADITLYAKWTANAYTITYKGMEDASLTPQPTQHIYGTATSIGNPTKTGYTFAGWKVNSGSTVTTNLTLGAKVYTANITLTATWAAATVNINATKCTHDGADKVAESGDYVVTFTPESGYSIPAKVTVQISSTALASDEYTYDNTTGTLTIPRNKITGNITITAKAVKNPVASGSGKDNPDNTVYEGEPDEDGSTVTYTGTYGEEYTPVIIVGDKEMSPGAEMTWNESEGKGEWTYSSDPDDEIKVEFRKRTITGITVTPDNLTIYADDAANESIDTLTSYLKEYSSAQASYDNKTKGDVQADYATTDSFAVKGKAYNYTVSADGKTVGLTLTVAPVTAAITVPNALKQRQKTGGYTAAEVKDWLPATVTVTYTGGTAKPESRAVTWNTSSIGADFGASVGDEKTIIGTVALPEWATGETTVSIVIKFIDKDELTDAQMNLSISGWAYGAQTVPAPQGSITVTDANKNFTYLYSADNGTVWGTAEDVLPKSESGNIIPGTYLVKMIYTGTDYKGTKTASFTVVKKPLAVKKGTLKVDNRNYDGTTDATLKEGGEPELSGVVAGDTVELNCTLSAVFTETGPKKDISVTVTGFSLEGRDAVYYRLENTKITLKATINNADGTPPSDRNVGGNGSDDNDGGSGNNGGSRPEDNGNPGIPAVTPSPIAPSVDMPQSVPKTEDSSGKGTETQPTQQPEESQENSTESKNTDTDTPGKDSSDSAQADKKTQPESGQQLENATVQTVPASIADGRLVVSDGNGSGDGSSVGTWTGDQADGLMTARTILQMYDEGGNPAGKVIVTVVCEEQTYTAGVTDTVAVVNAVLKPEQIQHINDGETLEVRIDVKDISRTVTGQDKEVIERGLTEYQNEIPELTLGMYVDISMFIRLGEGSWDAVTSTEEPIEVIIGIPEELQEDGREFYIIRSHEGEYTLLNDIDNDPDTVTIRTDMFSAYAIAFKQTDTEHALVGNTKCALCHICPTFLEICYFIWLAVIGAEVLVLVAVIVILRRKKETLQ